MSEQVSTSSDTSKCQKIKCNSQHNAVYGLGFIGAAIYYVIVATSFWSGVLGVLKAIVWPAFLVYEAMKYLGM